MSVPKAKHAIVKHLEEAMLLEFKNDWFNQINAIHGPSGRGGNKLRTYCTFKHEYSVEKYCSMIIPKVHRSALCKFRSGVAPLRIETGRYEGLPLDRRFCPFCNANNNSVIENESHVLLECNLYCDIRDTLFDRAKVSAPDFMTFSCDDKLKLLFTDSNLVRILAKTCVLILQRRQSYMCK